MNNPGLEDPIADTGAVAEDKLASGHPTDHERNDNRQNPKQPKSPHGRAFSQPKRWWFTSTAFPLLAGTFGPLANLMSVCALVQTWRIKIIPEGLDVHGERVADPAWLLAVNSVSLGVAIFANIVLLLNFARRIPYRYAQPVTIVGWYIASLLLISIIAAASVHLRQDEQDHAFSQSYYYAIISAALYAIISTGLLANAAGAYVFHAYPPSFSTLTIPQRTLMLQTISYTFYLGLGALVFSRIESWEYVDGVYWANYTLLTIGLGSDFPLMTVTAKALLIPYAVGGITMLGLVIGSVRSLVLDRGKVKVRRRAVEKQRRKAINRAPSTPTHSWRKNEFLTMRQVQERADRSRKYWSLVISIAAFLLLWLGGAMVFSFSERKQNWSYFQALYFSYTTLLTIGYGDFVPTSLSGRPFFVVWSLIAVPTMTILISNMGETVVSWVKNGTIWLGERTILPEQQLRKSWKQGLTKPTQLLKGKQRKSSRARDGESEQGILGTTATDLEKFGAETERMEQESEHAQRRKHPHHLPHPHHRHRHRNDQQANDSEGPRSAHMERRRLTAAISKEIRTLTQDLNVTPPKQYKWEEWTRWMALLGDEDGHWQGHEEGEWSWLGDEGPLLNEENTETEWVLSRLCERLEEIVMQQLEEVEER